MAVISAKPVINFFRNEINMMCVAFSIPIK